MSSLPSSKISSIESLKIPAGVSTRNLGKRELERNRVDGRAAVFTAQGKCTGDDDLVLNESLNSEPEEILSPFRIDRELAGRTVPTTVLISTKDRRKTSDYVRSD